MKEKLEMLLVFTVLALVGAFGLYILFTEGIILNRFGGTTSTPLLQWITCLALLLGSTYGIYAYWPWRKRPEKEMAGPGVSARTIFNCVAGVCVGLAAGFALRWSLSILPSSFGDWGRETANIIQVIPFAIVGLEADIAHSNSVNYWIFTSIIVALPVLIVSVLVGFLSRWIPAPKCIVSGSLAMALLFYLNSLHVWYRYSKDSPTQAEKFWEHEVQFLHANFVSTVLFILFFIMIHQLWRHRTYSNHNPI